MVQLVNKWKPKGPDPLSSGYEQEISKEVEKVKDFQRKLGLKRISQRQFNRTHKLLKAKEII